MLTKRVYKLSQIKGSHTLHVKDLVQAFPISGMITPQCLLASYSRSMKEQDKVIISPVKVVVLEGEQKSKKKLVQSKSTLATFDLGKFAMVEYTKFELTFKFQPIRSHANQIEFGQICVTP